MKNHLKFSAIIAAYFFITTALLPLQIFANKVTLECPLITKGETIVLANDPGIADLKSGEYEWHFWSHRYNIVIPEGFKWKSFYVTEGNVEDNEKVLNCDAAIGRLPVSAYLRIENVSKCVSEKNGSFICDLLLKKLLPPGK